MDQRIEKVKRFCQSFLSKKGKGNWLWVIGLVGILLIGFSSAIDNDAKDTPNATLSGEESTTVYAQALESRLENMVSAISGVGKCRVMVTMEQGTEYIYATQEKNTVDASQTSENSRFSTGSRSSDEETYIMVSTDEGQQPVLITALSPKVKGVVVVCQGGEDSVVCQNVRTALATLLNISSNRICVVTGNYS